MMKIYKSMFLWIVMTLLGLASAHAGERGTWVVRFDIDTPEKVKQICSQENQRQFDRYLVQVRGRADSWYESSFVPKAEGLSFDPLQAILDECQDVEVHVWLNVYYLWTGDRPPEDLRHPYYRDEWILSDRTGRSVKEYSQLEQRQRWIEGVYADPASVKYRTYFAEVVREIIEKYPVAGVHLDFVRYPGSFFGDGQRPALVKITRQQFAQWHNQSGDDQSLSHISQRLQWDQVRADHVTRLVREVDKVMTKVQPDLKLSASVFPDLVEAFLDKGQKWSDWLQEGLLDDLYVMAYFGTPARVLNQLSQCEIICDRYGVNLWAGLGAYIKSSVDIRREILEANQVGVDNICLFSLGHLLKQGKAIGSYRGVMGIERTAQGAELSPLVDLILSRDFKGELHNLPVEVSVAHADQKLRLRGIFRYVDGHDDYAKVQDQYGIMQTVQQELRQGGSFVTLSRNYSQAGSKRYGGVLPDVGYAETENKQIRGLFQLSPGTLSEIIPVHNGFWIFQVL